MRARKRWSFNAGFALAPDTNIGAGSEERTIFIPVFGQPLPFERDAEELNLLGRRRLGLGRGGVPGADRRSVAQAARRRRRGAAGILGLEVRSTVPRHPSRPALADRPEHRGEPAGERAAALGSAPYRTVAIWARAWRWGAGSPPRVTAFVNASWHDRRYRTQSERDGPVMDASLRGSWVVTPTVRADLSAGYGHERAKRERERNDSRWLGAGVTVILPAGFTVGGGARCAGPTSTTSGFRIRRRARTGRTARERPALGPQPGLHGVRLQPGDRGGARGARDQRAALRLPAHARRAEVRAAVLVFPQPRALGL